MLWIQEAQCITAIEENINYQNITVANYFTLLNHFEGCIICMSQSCTWFKSWLEQQMKLLLVNLIHNLYIDTSRK